MEYFIIPQAQNPNDQLWLQNLKKCQGIIISFLNEYKIEPEQVLEDVKKFNFIIELSEYFTQNQELRQKIQETMVDDEEFVFINEKNYQECLVLL